MENLNNLEICEKSKFLGSLQIPHKIKHLLWKAANNAIPMLLNLWRRKVVNVVVCPGCDSDCEDTIHALWSCPVLRPIREADSFTKKILKYKFSSFTDLLDMSFRFKEETDLNLLAVLFWSIWEKPNTVKLSWLTAKGYACSPGFCKHPTSFSFFACSCSSSKGQVDPANLPYVQSKLRWGYFQIVGCCWSGSYNLGLYWWCYRCSRWENLSSFLCCNGGSFGMQAGCPVCVGA